MYLFLKIVPISNFDSINSMELAQGSRYKKCTLFFKSDLEQMDDFWVICNLTREKNGD